MTGPGRPTTGVKVQVRIPAADLDYIDTWSRQVGITRAAMIRHLIEHGMNRVTDDEMAEWVPEGRA